MNKVSDESRSRNYFNQVPQIVWALSRSPQDYTLWNVIYMVAGEDGECYLGTEDLAELAMMSVGKVSDCRQYLLAVGLLKGERKKVDNSQNMVWHLSIPDIWEENIRWRKTIDSLKDRVKFKRYIHAALKKAGSLREFDKDKFLASVELKMFNATSLHNMKKVDYEGPISYYERPVSQYERKNNHQEEPKDVYPEEKISGYAHVGASPQAPPAPVPVDDFADLFPDKPEPSKNGRKSLDAFDVLMAGRLGTSEQEIEAERVIEQSGWRINARAVRQAMVLFLAYTRFDNPPAAEGERKRWFKALREMSDEFSPGDMKKWLSEAEKVFTEKQFTPTGPEAYTKVMIGLRAAPQVEVKDFSGQQAVLPETEIGSLAIFGDLIDDFR